MSAFAARILAEVLLVLALLASLGVNGCQYRKAVTDKYEDTIASLEAARETSDQLAADSKEEQRDLVTALGEIVERGRQVRTVYRQAAASAPLPLECAPGQTRMDAVNYGLGPIR